MASKPANRPMPPLFAEVTPDGKWHNNLHSRSVSHQDILQPTAYQPPPLIHRRSRSDVGAHISPSLDGIYTHQMAQMAPMRPLYSPQSPTDARNILRKEVPSTSRIPRPSMAPLPSELSKVNAFVVTSTPANPSSLPSSTRGRYNPPSISPVPNGQTLSAKIVAPLPKTSPPLRSSRPRQPVTSATTAASRARAAERFQGAAAAFSRDGRRPSEQWLGKPYDEDKERSRRKIPELANIDFAERRARIQKAISQNMEETRPDTPVTEFEDTDVMSRVGSIQIMLEHSVPAPTQAEETPRPDTPHIPPETPTSLEDDVPDTVLGAPVTPDYLAEETRESFVQAPPVTPDTPPGWREGEGTAVVYMEEEEDLDFHEKIRKADEAWERQQQGGSLSLNIEDDEERPMPPPKDIGYTPRSSIGPSSATFTPEVLNALRISTASQSDLRDFAAATEAAIAGDLVHVPSIEDRPPQPTYAPPPPPPPSEPSQSTEVPDVPQMPATYSERGSSELSPRLRKPIWGPSGSSRPSTDSQRQANLPGSVSMSSLADSTQNSIDASSITKSGRPASPSPEQKRLMKRRHVIKELLDTENSYHQDLKIIEDIYRATASPELISVEDRKVLFGNCDEIERFSLKFYDALRRAVAPVYVPAKQARWMGGKRASCSTTQSEAPTQWSTNTVDSMDEEKDRATKIGAAFLENMAQMERNYSAYLRNHDAANQRLATLKNSHTVKCWLDECHNNASDITSAWDLDSLLVKPTQRVAKYPMLLQQLLECTPPEHPDRDALALAAKDSVSMLTRINEAKKRADLVDQIINRKGKESDVRSGIAKAFGRRTEKFKERVGINEAYPDPEYEQLAQKFGGHFIRLQICMRDVQNYIARFDKAVAQITRYVNGFDEMAGIDSTHPEMVARWHQWAIMMREALSELASTHKRAVNSRVIEPMVACIKLYENPEHALNKRKKRIVDYAKCKSVEKRGEKPDKKMLEAAEQYTALNEQLKIDLPKLYTLTGTLVQACLGCFLKIQLEWLSDWERKVRPALDACGDAKTTVEDIERDFTTDFKMVRDKFADLGVSNGAVLAEAANFLSPTSTFERTPIAESSRRTTSVGSEAAPSPLPGASVFKRQSSDTVEMWANRPWANPGGVFDTVIPVDAVEGASRSRSPSNAEDDTPVLFVCASLFEFSIDATRREGGYPYLTYVQGEVFDVVAQKGELWLAKNQDDVNNSLGWIWEQHFVILSQD